MIDTDRLTIFAQSLVQTQSYSGQEEPVVERILAEMRALGYDHAWADENGAAVGVIEGGQPGPTLLLDAHCDTVGIAPGSTWTRAPFGGELDGGYLYGRGSADMKGALAAMVHGAAAVDRARLAGRVAVSATVMEEVLEGTSLQTVMDAVQPACVVIGEASELNLNRGGRGRAEIHLETIGRPAHSSSPQLGINAIHGMLPIIAGLEALPLGHHPLMGPAILALTDIISEPYPGHSVLPSRCRASYDRRLLPGETPEAVMAAVRALTPGAGASFQAAIGEGEYTSYTGRHLHETKFFPAWVFEEAHPFVQSALSGLRAAGLQPTIGAYGFCTNAAYSAGKAGVPTVGFGPAAEGDAHVVDERLSLAQLQQAAAGYLGIITATIGTT